MEKTLNIYFAGALFNAKDLIGNRMICDELANKFPRYKFVLPQDLQFSDTHPKTLRDTDINAVLSSDAAIFNFDGSELDSGTVAEFMLAKFADKPALILRTDFRGGGDQNGGLENSFEPWNLMLSFYPRTRSLLINSAALYKESFVDGKPDFKLYCQKIAKKIAIELGELFKLAPIMPLKSKVEIEDWLRKMSGLK